LVAAGTLQAVASLGLVWSPDLWAILGFVVLLQTGQAVTAPAWTALVPRIVGDELISRAVGLQQSLAGLAGLAGAALGGLLYQVLGYHVTMLIDTLSFAVLAATALFVRTRRGRRYDVREDRGRPAPDVVDPTSESGLHFVAHDPLLRLLLPALMLFVLSVEGTNVVEVFLIRDDFGASAAMYGVVIAGFMIGQIIGPLLGGRVPTDRRRVSLSALAAAVIGGLLIAIGLAPGVWLAVPLFVVCGTAGGALNSMLGALTLRRSPESMRGRVSALITGAARGCSVLAMVLGGIAGQFLGARTTFVVGGGLAVLVAFMVRSSGHGLDIPAHVSDDRVAEPV
jgi:MFS family permease